MLPTLLDINSEAVIPAKLIEQSLPTSLCQREDVPLFTKGRILPLFGKEGRGEIFETVNMGHYTSLSGALGEGDGASAI